MQPWDTRPLLGQVAEFLGVQEQQLGFLLALPLLRVCKDWRKTFTILICEGGLIGRFPEPYCHEEVAVHIAARLAEGSYHCESKRRRGSFMKPFPYRQMRLHEGTMYIHFGYNSFIYSDKMWITARYRIIPKSISPQGFDIWLSDETQTLIWKPVKKSYVCRCPVGGRARLPCRCMFGKRRRTTRHLLGRSDRKIALRFQDQSKKKNNQEEGKNETSKQIKKQVCLQFSLDPESKENLTFRTMEDYDYLPWQRYFEDLEIWNGLNNLWKPRHSRKCRRIWKELS
jgi:hypothetical protein